MVSDNMYETGSRFIMTGADIVRMGEPAEMLVGGKIDFEEIARQLGYNVLQSPQDQYVNGCNTVDAIAGGMGWCFKALELEKEHKPDWEVPRQPNFVLLKVAKGARIDLGRPKEPPQENKKLYMKTLGVTL